jgi:hypothetical protein
MRGSVRKFGILLCLAAAACGTTAPPGPAGISAAAGQDRVGESGLIDETVWRMTRVCRYTGEGFGAPTRVHRVGLGQRCPATFPTIVPNLRAPPTARLEGSTVEEGRRHCTYSQGSRRWTIPIALDRSCPLNAGMAS